MKDRGGNDGEIYSDWKYKYMCLRNSGQRRTRKTQMRKRKTEVLERSTDL